MKSIVICAPVIQEILQGISEPNHLTLVKDALLSLPMLENPISMEIFLEASEIYRIGRKKGYTICSSVDCLISAIAIKNKVPIHQFDRDFDYISKYTSLAIRNKI